MIPPTKSRKRNEIIIQHAESVHHSEEALKRGVKRLTKATLQLPLHASELHDTDDQGCTIPIQSCIQHLETATQRNQNLISQPSLNGRKYKKLALTFLPWTRTSKHIKQKNKIVCPSRFLVHQDQMLFFSLHQFAFCNSASFS